jgi:GTP cyclohydrolase IA
MTRRSLPPTLPPEELVRQLLIAIGEDPEREGLKRTPERVVRAWREIYAGYSQSARDILRLDRPSGERPIFRDGACDAIISLRGVEFYSRCEHHMEPFVGKAYIGYLPDKQVIGVSKLARLLEVHARRLQIQERVGDQITADLMKYLRPKGAGCVLIAKHMCMTCRGVNKQESEMVTSSMLGWFRRPAIKDEFLRMCGL